MPRHHDLPLPDLHGTRAVVTGASDGMGLLGGAPREHRPFAPLRDPADAARVWDLSESLTGLRVAG